MLRTLVASCTKPLLQTLLMCLDFTGRVELSYCSSFVWLLQVSLIFSPLSVNTICNKALSVFSITDYCSFT